MPYRHRRTALIRGLALAALCCAPLGCASYAEPGPGVGLDAGGRDTDGGPVDPSTDAGVVPQQPVENGGAEAAIGCFDFVDADGDGSLDCDDADCAREPLCCVGSSSDFCCDDSTVATVDFAGCGGTGSLALSSCAAGATFFGSPSPELRDGAMVPFGGDRFDSGMVLADSVDPGVARLSLRGEIAEGDTCDGCIDAIAFGLTSAVQGGFGATTLVDPDVALMVSTSQREVRLIVGGAVAISAEIEALRGLLEAGADAPITYELSTTPDGLASVSARVGERMIDVFSDVPYAPRGPARVVLWGRSTNRAGETEPASIRRIEVVASTCDSPTSLERSDLPILPDDVDAWWPRDARPSAPSVVHYDDAGEPSSLMAFAYEGRIHLAGGIAGGRFRALGDPTVATNAAVRPSPTEAWRAERVLEPELVRIDGHWEIWFTAIGEDGARSIGRATGGASATAPFTVVTRMLPSMPADTSSWDGPDHFAATIRGVAMRYLVARRGIGSSSEIVMHVLAPGGDGLTAQPATTYDGLANEPVDSMAAHRATQRPVTFDADEVAGPALVQYGGVLRLYYAGRRGTRWAIGVLLSEDGRYWRAANDGEPVLGGSGSAFDALSVSDPEPVLVGDELRLYYTGSDGVGAGIGLSRHRVPEATAP